jgi:hypothetical protein
MDDKRSIHIVIIHIGIESQTRAAQMRMIDANTFEYEGTILRRVTR